MSDSPTDLGRIAEAWSVGQLCTSLGISKRRFYELQHDGVFPRPSAYHLSSRRPLYFLDDWYACKEVMRTNVGSNGKIILFYARRAIQAEPSRPQRPSAAPRQRSTTERRRPGVPRQATADHRDLIESLAALGVAATAAQVRAGLAETFPTGTAGSDDGEVVRRLYQHLRARNSTGNVER